MDIISYNEGATANGRIEKFNSNPDSNSGVLTQPKVIEAGETVTIKSGRQAILTDMVVEGDLVIEAGADVSMLASVVPKSLEDIIDTLDSSIVKLMGNQTIEDVKTFTSSPIVPTPTTDFQVATKKYVDDAIGGGTGTGGGIGLSVEDKAKLDGIEVGATKNKTDAFLLDRSNHTGSIPISVVENLEQELANISTGGSGGGYFTGTAGITVGGIATGDTFTDVPVTDMINNLINPELTPNLTNPNNVLTSTVSGLREIGTSITPRLTATFNRGSISPQYSASEPYRAGLPTKYVFTSTAGLNQEVETDATTYGIDVSSFEVALGTVTFSSNISYSAGPQPTTSKGNVFNNPLPAGTTGNKTVTITGVYPCYNGISTLTKMTLANHGGTITVDAPADMNVGGERFKIQYPTVWSAKTPVVQQENELSKAWDNQNISDYSITTIDKNGVSYKQVVYIGAGIGARKLRLVF